MVLINKITRELCVIKVSGPTIYDALYQVRLVFLGNYAFGPSFLFSECKSMGRLMEVFSILIEGEF